VRRPHGITSEFFAESRGRRTVSSSRAEGRHVSALPLKHFPHEKWGQFADWRVSPLTECNKQNLDRNGVIQSMQRFALLHPTVIGMPCNSIVFNPYRRSMAGPLATRMLLIFRLFSSFCAKPVPNLSDGGDCDEKSCYCDDDDPGLCPVRFRPGQG